MGWGDEIMVTGQARRMQLADPRPVAVRGRNGLARWHPIWEGNPRLVRGGGPYLRGAVQWLENYSGHRPYLDYSRFNNADKREPYVFTDWRVEPGEIYLNAREKTLGRLAAGMVILEPNLKAPKSTPNKDWSWSRWVALAAELRGLPLAQIGDASMPRLPGVPFIETASFREACGVLSGAALAILPEGGLHHAAAALGVPAIVIFGGFISPATTGYDMHINLFTGGEACGMRVACPHCAEAMAKIAPGHVAELARCELAKSEGGQAA